MSFFLSPFWDKATSTARVQDTSPPYMRKSPEKVAKTALGAGTQSDYFQMDGFSHWSMQYSYVPGATNSYVVKLYATWQDDGTAAASCTYIDVTTAVLGVASIAVALGTTQSGFMVDNLQLLKGCKYIKHEVVITGGASNSAYTLDKNARV